MDKLHLVEIPNPFSKLELLKLSYQVFGKKLDTAPVVLVNHALTGNSLVAGEKGWWNSIIGENKVIDLNTYSIIAFDIPGNEYHIKNNPELDYKVWSTQEIAGIFWKALDVLGVQNLHSIIGGSLGGGIAWEMFHIRPNVIDNLVPVATHYKASAWVIGNIMVQDNILNQKHKPIEIARQHAMHLYRTPASLHEKFGDAYNEEENQYEIESWLNYHGRRLKSRFSLSAYKHMNHLIRTIGRNISFEELKQQIKNTKTKIHIISVDTDLLFTQAEQYEMYQNLKHLDTISYHEIASIHGHDAFLIEYPQLEAILKTIY